MSEGKCDQTDKLYEDEIAELLAENASLKAEVERLMKIYLAECQSASKRLANRDKALIASQQRVKELHNRNVELEDAKAKLVFEVTDCIDGLQAALQEGWE